MAQFEHACFISYKHPPPALASVKHSWLEFIEAFERRLQSFLTVNLPVYRDEQLDDEPGAPYPTELSTRMCESVCMVAFLVPQYLESSWCVDEWKAMEKLEVHRLGNDKGLILPIVMHGQKESFEQFVGERHVADFSHIVAPKQQLKTVGNSKRIKKMAERISRFSSSLGGPSVDCGTFTITEGTERVIPSPDADPDPLAQ